MEYIDWLRVTLFVLAIVALWTFAGYLKIERGFPTGYTRKLNHAFTLLFGAAWFLPLPLEEARWSFRLAGALLMLLILFVCYFHARGLRRYMFFGYAREKDAPHEAFHVWFSFAVSLAAILVLDFLFGDKLILAMGVLLLGIGDALGEPIGMRFGKHRYTVSGILSAQTSVRSLEGSGAVVIGSFVTALAVLALFGGMKSPSWMMLSAGTLAFVVTLVEAYTPHGLDNFTIPLAAAICLRMLYGFV